MGFYILLYTLCIALGWLSIRFKQKRFKFLLESIIVLGLILVSGTRYYLGGSDYSVYMHAYDSIPSLKDLIMYGPPQYPKMEIGYIYINSFFKTLGFSFYGFTLAMSTVFYATFYAAIKRIFPSFAYVLPIFFYKIFFFNTFTSMRQPIVLAIFIFSLKFVHEHKAVKFYSLIIPCALIHISSLFLLPLYPLLARRAPSRIMFTYFNVVLILLFILSFFGILTVDPTNTLQKIFIDNITMTEKINNYFIGAKSVNLLNFGEYILLALLFVFNLERIKKSEYGPLMIWLFLLTGVVICVFYKYEIIVRMKDFMIISYAYLIWACVDPIKNSLKKLAYSAAVVTICLLGFVRIPITFDGGRSLLPYKSFVGKESIYK